MKQFRMMAMFAAMTAFTLSAAAQHGRGASMGSMGGGHAMGHQPTMSSHERGDATANSTSHGQRTMDQKLTTNTKLAGKISDLTGMSAKDACNGFKNLGQCVAAAHVSQNLGIKFTDLKDTMLGLNADGTQSTTAKPMSLGKAIATLDPQANTKTEVKKANQQAKSDSETSGS